MYLYQIVTWLTQTNNDENSCMWQSNNDTLIHLNKNIHNKKYNVTQLIYMFILINWSK